PARACVHWRPSHSLFAVSDGMQAIFPDEFASIFMNAAPPQSGGAFENGGKVLSGYAVEFPACGDPKPQTGRMWHLAFHRFADRLCSGPLLLVSSWRCLLRLP